MALLGACLLATPALAVDWDSARLGAYYPPTEVSLPAVHEAAAAVVRFPQATGFVVDSRGLILTNHHVRQSFGTRGEVRVGWTDTARGRPLRVELVAEDAARDVALYRVVDAAPGLVLPAIELRDGPAVVGEDVFVIGHPDGDPQRVSFGEVLATDLHIGGRPSVEYSAQTWWGSSGSPVLDADGRLIAIHWGWDSSGSSNGRLTGVPTEHILDALPQLAEATVTVPAVCSQPRGYSVRARAIRRDVRENAQGRSLDHVRASLVVADARCAASVADVRWTLHPTFRDPIVHGDAADHGVTLMTWGHFDVALKITLSDGQVVAGGGRIAW